MLNVSTNTLNRHFQSLSPSSSCLLTHFLPSLLEKLLKLSSWGLPSFDNFFHKPWSWYEPSDINLLESYQANEVATRCCGLEDHLFLSNGRSSSDWASPSYAGTNEVMPLPTLTLSEQRPIISKTFILQTLFRRVFANTKLVLRSHSS